MSNITDMTVSGLVASKSAETFTVTWTYGGTASNFRIYRFISNSIETDSTIIDDDPISKDSGDDGSITENFKLLSSTASSPYTDNLAGVSQAIKDDIFNTKRQVYYKVIAEDTASVAFNSLPYTFIGHNNGRLVCYSNIRQVLFNTFFEENDVIWSQDVGSVNYGGTDYGNVRAIAPDLERGYVWAIINEFNETNTGNSKVVRININETYKGTAAAIASSTVWAFSYPLYSLRINPDNGEGIVGGRNRRLVRCRLSGSIASATGNGAFSLGSSSFGNYGLTLSKNGNNLLATTIWDKHYVLQYNITTVSNGSLIDTDVYGGEVTPSARPYVTDQYNTHGIHTGPDNQVFVNGYQQVYRDYSWNDRILVPQTCTDSWCAHDPAESGCNPTVPDPGGTPDDPYWNYGSESTHRSSWDCSYYTNNKIEVYEDFFSDQMYLWRINSASQTSPDKTDIFTNCDGDRLNWPCTTWGSWQTEFSPWTRIGPTYSTDGFAASLPYSGSLFSSSNYYLWQADLIEDAIHQINNATDADIAEHNVITNPMDTCVDSQNTVWAISKDSTHKRYYQLDNNAIFPTGYLCTWPDDINSTTWIYGSHGSDKYVEYVLTRATGQYLAATITAIKNAATDALKRELAFDAWYTEGGQANKTGALIYPDAPAPGTGWGSAIARYYSTHSWHPNADETGMSYLFTKQSADSVPYYASPGYVYPVSQLFANVVNSTPPINDGQFWNNQNQSDSTTGAASGYDDLQIEFNFPQSNAHSFELNTWHFDYGDKPQDIGQSGSYPNAGSNPQGTQIFSSNIVTYIYHDPSLSHKPGERRSGGPGEATGTYTAAATAIGNANAYLLDGSPGLSSEMITPIAGLTINYGLPISGSDTTTVDVWERWPTTQNYPTPFDTASPGGISEYWMGFTKWQDDNPSEVGDNGLGNLDYNRIISGYDPLSAVFTDMSIGRTWPITAWRFNFGDDQPYPPTLLNSFVQGITSSKYSGTTVHNVICADETFHPRDAETTHNNFVQHVWFTPGTYYVTIHTEASASGTKSADISAGVTDQATLATFTSETEVTTAQVIVLESCPQANFITLSAVTVPSNYSDTNDGSFYTPTCAAYTSVNYVSGYAPNLTLTFMDSSIARSYPISSYAWDNGDWYNETVKTSSVNASTALVGYPIWTTEKTNHTIQHQYVMPGCYTVTLNCAASTTGTQSCTLCAKSGLVYVEEINPDACTQVSVSSTTGYSSAITVNNHSTVYFNSSCTTPGSFPICRIDYDFGDGSDIYTVTRWPSAVSLNTTVTAFPLDLADPRNVIVEHTYERTLVTSPTSFTPRVSTYACNTNTVDIYIGTQVIVVGLYDDGDDAGDTAEALLSKPKHLIETRMYQNSDDLLLVFEGETGQRTMLYEMPGDE